MRGVVFTGNRNLELMTFGDPTPGSDQAVIRMKASGMCGSDLHLYRAANPLEHVASQGQIKLGPGGLDPNTRIIAGHEPCGVVEAIGKNVNPDHFKPGDRVIVYHYVGCGVCDHCHSGWYQMCVEGTKAHGHVIHGSHAEFIVVPANTLVKLPDEVSFVGGAAIACGTGTAFGALVRMNVSARDTLAVYGLGPVGLSAVQLAASMGATVIGVDIDPGRVELAEAFGAHHVINGKTQDPIEEVMKLTRYKGATCAMDCAGGKVAKQQAVASTAAWGRIAMVAVNGDLDIGVWSGLIAKQRTILGSWTFSINGMKDCAEYIADRGVEVDKIFSDHWSIDEAAEAYRAFDKQTGGKGVFVFG